MEAIEGSSPRTNGKRVDFFLVYERYPFLLLVSNVADIR